MEQPQTLVAQPMRYLDKAMGALRDLGLPLPPPAVEATPITGLLSQLGDLDPDRVTLIARVLNQATVFNEVVREQIRAMQIAERYEVITNSFNSIRDDAKEMVNQLSDGRISTGEKLRNMWMNVRRGDISSRFQKIRDTYLEVSKDTKTNIDRERAILEAYRDFRGAMKQAEVLTLELLKTAEGKLAAAKAAVEQAGAAVDAAGSIEPAAARPAGDGAGRGAAGRCRTRTAATRSARTWPTTWWSPTTPPRSSWPGWCRPPTRRSASTSNPSASSRPTRRC